MAADLPQVMYTLNHWLRQGRNDKPIKLTIECADDNEFFATYGSLRAEISCLQWAITDPRKDFFPIKTVDQQMQIEFEMMGHKIVIKSAQKRAEPIRAYFRGNLPGWPE